MQSGRRKGASIICIIGGNEIDEKTFGSVFLLCICGLQKRKTVSEKATRAARQRPQFGFFVSTSGDVLEQIIISDN